ncbi:MULTISPECIES: Hcp family type VI secretion system effector [Xenorhabdus]|uniref:Type VI secretion system effector, Hcp1 family n=1 Tax=Xenorhabdus ehlersii TaxID=290111 RepID=A0A2D0IS43_9GAMM|nr:MULTISPECIES: type VI secretion system tube protein Hcp [Xenorhabdus]MBC8949533.1 type VI secretion system effector, Hcp1 family [Xenorhabdus sp. TS4]PHM24715.1 type VI secretion system effector, Hcp1 family [Xenorhabdus ehlersii]RKE91353.1 type VI secretion system secreted protein Hcp [Xenorhabdus ehlersii]
MSIPGIDAYINFTDVKGESGDNEFKEWTAVRSFSLEVMNNVSSHSQGSGLGAGIVAVSGLSLDILFDKSTITLRQYLVKGTHIKEVQLKVRRQGGKQEPWYTLVLTNSLVAQSSLIYGDGGFCSSIFLAFQKHKESYFSQEYGSGAKGAEVSYEWDSYANKGG